MTLLLVVLALSCLSSLCVLTSLPRLAVLSALLTGLGRLALLMVMVIGMVIVLFRSSTVRSAALVRLALWLLSLICLSLFLLLRGHTTLL